jgi:membrane protein
MLAARSPPYAPGSAGIGARTSLRAGGIPTCYPMSASAHETTVLFGVILAAHRILTPGSAFVRHQWVGSLVGAGALVGLLKLGVEILPRLVARAGPVYGSFATVIGVLSLIYLASQVLVLPAEVSAVTAFRLWPRGLLPDRPTDADLRALWLLTREQERLPRQRNSVSLESSGPDPG